MTGPTNPRFRDGTWTRYRRRLEADVRDLMSKVLRFEEQITSLADPWARARGTVLLERFRAVPPPDGPAGWAMTTRRGAVYVARKFILVARRWRALALAVLRLIRAALARTWRAIESLIESPTDAGGSPPPKAFGLRSGEASETGAFNTSSSHREEAVSTKVVNESEPNEAMNRKRHLWASTVQTAEELLRLYNAAVPTSMREPSMSWLDGIRAGRRLREHRERTFWVRAFGEISRSRQLLGLDPSEPEALGSFSRMMRRTWIPGFCGPESDGNGVAEVAVAAGDGHWRSDPDALARLARRIPELRGLWVKTQNAIAEAERAEEFTMWGWAA